MDKLLADRVLVLDGAMGTMIQRFDLTEEDFRWKNKLRLKPHNSMRFRGCNDLLCLTRPDVITAIHKEYLNAGADIISTNTFNANAISLADYELHDDDELIRKINRAGAALARAAADKAPLRAWGGKAIVAGSMGPTNKTATISPDVTGSAVRNVTYDELFTAYRAQVCGLMEGGVDILLFETVFDTLNLKAGLDAANAVMAECGKDLPIMVSATVSRKSGKILSGESLSEIVASVENVEHIISLGLNCCAGPKEIIPHVKTLAGYTSHFISTHPNAGLPDELGNYNVTPEAFAEGIRQLLEKGVVNIIGGCCGTTPQHIAALRSVVDEVALLH